ncbi:MAG: hypothetical protein VKK32_09585 [Candidatus Melainabacteria bacterium]|nr:hypothetical protein [Candidatus Melainabacteria bacterium]
MFMPGPDNINKPPNLSTQIEGAGGAKAANNVSEDGVSAAEGKHSKILRNGATVNGSGVDGNAAGQAKLGMMANNIVPTNGFFKGNVGKKERVTGEDTIQAHVTALLLDGTEADNQFKELMQRASRGAEPSSGKFSQREIELGRQAVIPLDGPDAQFKELLKYAFSLADRQGPITTGAIINSFHEAQE